ncbi:hypothetical protein BAUCODRAFT_147364 [Baudoinia panamericana UAMH 10762]|uniref:Survival motor neuron Tudor domain-containing protein n=1 Tax=Baudoinia panamericana (strain UAMH 10762) TaxID=717646 RepID=M2NE49_BAUPA|nr:uncharacterized protein BAUCODRAFT_147364 [Baudoinia panamericana UAMH 10762]EMC97220.1 hypothetical protein BAUCODRAFT_147364 [Baudoinia panamericana UAMH 10762]
MAGRNMSHEEVWDDSALVTSWNEALDEYKKYHSIAVKGQSVEDMFDEAERIQQLNGYTNAIAEIDRPKLAQHSAEAATAAQPKSSDVKSGTGAGQEKPTAQSAALPNALLGSVQDEGLKNIMMSWYYAGYYTGLYEGQQKAYSAMQQGV